MRSTQQLCTVTQEALEVVANSLPKLLIKNGKILVSRTLFMIGFDIDHGYSVSNGEVLVRDPSNPSKVYYTTTYNGRTRNEVKGVINGKIHYSKIPHHMSAFFKHNEVLSCSNISKDLLQDINGVGSELLYNKGMASLNKAVDSEATTRNIVRK